MSKINLQEPQRNCNATANYVNLIRTSTVRERLKQETQYKSYTHLSSKTRVPPYTPTRTQTYINTFKHTYPTLRSSTQKKENYSQDMIKISCSWKQEYRLATVSRVINQTVILNHWVGWGLNRFVGAQPYTYLLTRKMNVMKYYKSLNFLSPAYI